MTTTALAPARRSSVARERVVAVFRLHFVNIRSIIVIPLVIMAVIFAANFTIWALIAGAVDDPADLSDAQQGFSYSGSTFYIFVYMMVVAVMAIAQTFPFAQGFGVTRRDFYLGSSLAFVALSAGYGALLTVLSLIEDATGGWGLRGSMFTTLYFGNGAWWLRFLLFTTIFLFFFFVGAACAAVFQRWRATGLVAMFVVLAFALIGLLALVGAVDGWDEVGAWFVATGPNGVIAWTLVPTAVSAVAGYLLLRGATTRNQ
jgi:hypothetical protein